MFKVYSDEDVAEVHAKIDHLRVEANIPAFELARALLDHVEEIVKDVTSAHKEAGKPLHEPDFMNTLRNISSTIESANPF